MRKFEYFRPKSLQEASELMKNFGEKGSILNGGTDLIVRMGDKICNPRVVVDIKDIEGLKEITYDEKNGLIIGACVTMNEMGQHPILLKKYGIIAQASHTVGSCQVRNRATMVGNIVNASPLADTATPLLVLDAYIRIFGEQGEKEISIHDFFLGVRKNSLKNGEIVTAIRIPHYNDSIIGDYQKHSRRKEVDLATVCVSVIKIEKEIRIALGAVASTPLRVRKTENYLNNKKLTEELIEEAGQIILEEISPITDVRASREYRRHIASVLVKRGLRNIRGQLEGGNRIEI